MIIEADAEVEPAMLYFWHFSHLQAETACLTVAMGTGMVSAKHAALYSCPMLSFRFFCWRKLEMLCVTFSFKISHGTRCSSVLTSVVLTWADWVVFNDSALNREGCMQECCLPVCPKLLGMRRVRNVNFSVLEPVPYLANTVVQNIAYIGLASLCTWNTLGDNSGLVNPPKSAHLIRVGELEVKYLKLCCFPHIFHFVNHNSSTGCFIYFAFLFLPWSLQQ